MDEQNALTNPEPSRVSARLRRYASPVASLLAIALLVLVWQWYDTRSQVSSLREEIAGRLRDSDADSRDARVGARQAQEGVREAQAKIAQLEAKLIESQNQQVALEALYQELSRSRDEWVLADVEQILTIASQQLQLAGSVQAALAALQTADARLARSDRPQFLPLRKILARDIEKLKGMHSVDIPGIALKLDQVIAQVDTMPLGFEERAGTVQGAQSAVAADGFWRKLGSDIWGEFKQLVRVRNLERPEPALLAPSQAFFLRENLKLRLLNARLALLSRDQAVFREDLGAASTWIQRYFDLRSRPAAAAVASLKQLGVSGISIDAPTIGESLTAVRNYKVSREKATR